MPKPDKATSTYWQKLRDLSAWNLILVLLTLLPIGALGLTPRDIKEEYLHGRLMKGLFAYYPSFFLSSTSKGNSFCLLIPPARLCNNLFWFLADFYHGNAANHAKEICGEYVKLMFDSLIESGAHYIHLTSGRLPKDYAEAYGFCSKLGTDILCFGDLFGREPHPNKTIIDFVLQRADDAQYRLSQSPFNSNFSMFITALLFAILTYAVLNRAQSRPHV